MLKIAAHMKLHDAEANALRYGDCSLSSKSAANAMSSCLAVLPVPADTSPQIFRF